MILLATLTPGQQLPKTPDINGFDKFVHFSLFLVWALLYNRAGIKDMDEKLNKKRFITNYLVFGIVIGILVEYLQQHIPGRSFDYWDIVANISGATIGTVGFYILHRKHRNLV